MKQPKIVYYHDLIHDDFAGTNIDTQTVPADYRYISRSPLYRAAAFGVYHLFARPLVTVAVKVHYHQRFVGKWAFRRAFRKALKQGGGKGAFLYANHTMLTGDAFIPNIIDYRRKNYIVTGADAVSIKGIRCLVKMLGALPLSASPNGMRAFCSAVETRVREGKTVTVYPEAHIWPYYTGIRPFAATSFRYPVQCGVPVFVITNVFKKRRLSLFSRPRVVSYVDGPFYPDPALSARAAAQDLRDRVYAAMCARAALSDYEYIRYLPAEEQEREDETAAG